MFRLSGFAARPRADENGCRVHFYSCLDTPSRSTTAVPYRDKVVKQLKVPPFEKLRPPMEKVSGSESVGHDFCERIVSIQGLSFAQVNIY